MNGEVSMQIDRREGVLAVPVDAVRSVRELPQAATALGLDPKAVQAEVTKLVAARAAERSAIGDTGRATGRAGFGAADSSGRRGRWAGRAGGDSSGRGRGSGRRGGLAGGGSSGGAAAGGGQFSGVGSGAGSGGGQVGGTGGRLGGTGGGAGGMGAGRMNRAQVVFVQTEKGPAPRLVRLGLSDFDYSEVLQGVTEGENVVLLGVAEAQASRTETQNRVRQRMGGGAVPGVPGGGGSGGRTGGGGR